MPDYHVTWEIDAITADSPEAAAQLCREMLLDPTNTASIFQVEDEGGGNTVEIDIAVEIVVPAFGANADLDELLHTLFVTALEGGIGYWASSSSYHHSNSDDYGDYDLEGFYSDIEDASGDDDFEPTRIDRTVVYRGLAGMASGRMKVRGDIATMCAIALIDADNDDLDFDAGDADCIVQAGLFGEIVYG